MFICMTIQHEQKKYTGKIDKKNLNVATRSSVSLQFPVLEGEG